MEQHTISLIIESVTLVCLCVTWNRVNKAISLLEKIRRQKEITSNGVQQPSDDLSLRLGQLQTMKFSPMGNIVNLQKRRETK